jgi:hypothetical protein
MPVDSLEAIQAGDTTQWIRVRGADDASPVLLPIQQGRPWSELAGQYSLCAPLPVSRLAVRAAPNGNSVVPTSRAAYTRPLV